MAWKETPPFRPNVIVELVGDCYAVMRRRVCTGVDAEALTVIDRILEHASTSVRGFMVRAEPSGPTHRYRRGHANDSEFRPCPKEELDLCRSIAEKGWSSGSRVEQLESHDDALTFLEDVYASIWGPRVYWRQARMEQAKHGGAT